MSTPSRTSRAVDDDHVVITLRGVGELQPHNPANRVTLSGDTDEFGVRRAFVSLGDPRDAAQPGETIQTTNDRATWNAMDAMADDVRAVIVGTSTSDDLARYRDGLGTTHHEAGTLWMGTDPARSVTTPDARFHNVVNAYALGPALLPTIGSPGPMLSGVALARRLGDHLVAPLPPPDLEDGFEWLFDGTAATFRPLGAGRPRRHAPRRGRGAGDGSTGRRHRPVVLRRPRLRRLRPPAAVPHRRPERQHAACSCASAIHARRRPTRSTHD